MNICSQSARVQRLCWCWGSEVRMKRVHAVLLRRQQARCSNNLKGQVKVVKSLWPPDPQVIQRSHSQPFSAVRLQHDVTNQRVQQQSAVCPRDTDEAAKELIFECGLVDVEGLNKLWLRMIISLHAPPTACCGFLLGFFSIRYPPNHKEIWK